MIDYTRLDFQSGQLRAEVAWLGRTTAEKQTDAYLPRLAILANPMSDGHNTIGRMFSERPFADNMMQAPRPYFDAVIVAQLQECSQAGLQFARRSGQRPFRLQLPPCRAKFLIPRR